MGQPRNGGTATDITLIVDLSRSYDSSTPGWLIQLLAQYGLAEMMTKIKKEAEAPLSAGYPSSSSGFNKIYCFLAPYLRSLLRDNFYCYCFYYCVFIIVNWIYYCYC